MKEKIHYDLDIPFSTNCSYRGQNKTRIGAIL